MRRSAVSLNFCDKKLTLALSGLSATFVGNGIGRFAFIALFPVIIQLGWFDYKQTSYLGAATLLGYLIGAPLCSFVSKKISATFMLRAAMLLCSLSYIVSAFPEAGFYWFLMWRTITGISGAILMVLAPALMLEPMPKTYRNRAAGIIFSGVGLGAMASGVLVPLLLLFGLKATWIVLGAICLCLTILTWNQWEQGKGQVRPQNLTSKNYNTFPIILLLIAYALNAVGYLPHTLFWVDYITRELHMSINMGGFFWAVFGLGAVIGPMITSSAANNFGLLPTLLSGFMLKAVGVALPLISHAPWSLFFSALLVGIFTPGIVNIVSGYALKLTGINDFQKIWGWLTFSFALAQALMSYVMIIIMLHYSSYQPLFMISALALLVSCLCVILLMRSVKFSKDNCYA